MDDREWLIIKIVVIVNLTISLVGLVALLWVIATYV
jgi:hypothetical protein